MGCEDFDRTRLVLIIPLQTLEMEVSATADAFLRASPASRSRFIALDLDESINAINQQRQLTCFALQVMHPERDRGFALALGRRA